MTNLTSENLYEYQEKNGYFKANPENEKPAFSIMIPPPNITGQLHVGHAFNMTMQDIIIRYKRMTGFDTLLLPGTDHASIATQMLVEKHLLSQGIKRLEIGRTAFIEKTWQWKEKHTGDITKQLRKIGYSADWSRERFTMDDGLSEAVKEAFVKLYDQGLIYKDSRLVNWDPSLLTSLSDLEVNMIETNGHMYHINYKIEGTDELITVATTRPETMLGDTGIAVNPEDERYKHLVGKFAILPILGRKIKIVADDYADMTKGTGAVKITPAHDFNDFEVGKRTGLEIINIFTPTGKIDISNLEENDFVKTLDAVDRFDARKIIIEKLKELGNFVKVENYTHQIPHSDRGGAIVEPRITEQWYLDVSSMAKKSVDFVREGKIKFIPKVWENTFFSWMENIEPWCISRQLWWGHQIPAYYTDDGKIIVAKSLEEAREKAGVGVNLTQDEDTLDTWFSSGLWPMSTLGWPNEDAMDFKKYFPTSTLITGFDIIFFWVARMIMFSIHFTGKAPFENVVFHGLVRDENGEKMSKTKGNVINPIELIEEYDVDTLRWTICALSGQGRDINFGKTHIENSKRFITKIKNAINFWDTNGIKKAAEFESSKSIAITNWILDKMNIAIKDAKTSIENYRYDEYAETLYHFIWGDFCDNFIELSKSELKTENKDIILSTANLVIKNIIKMLAPVIPFVSAELWENIGYGNGPDLINETYPENIDINTDDTENIDWMLNVISSIRNIRAENKIGFKTSIEIAFKVISDNKKDYIQKVLTQTNTALTDYNDNMINSVIDKDTTISFNLSSENKDEAIKKAKEELSEVEKRIQGLQAQLRNKAFTDKAPPQVIEDREKSLSDSIKKKEQLEAIING